MGQQSPHTEIVLLASRGPTVSNLKPILPPGLTRERGGPTEQLRRLPARLRAPTPAGGGALQPARPPRLPAQSMAPLDGAGPRPPQGTPHRATRPTVG